MGITHLSGLEVAGVPTQGMGGALPLTTNNYFFVSSVTGNNGNTGAADNPFATIDYAIGQCTANKGDTIVVMQGHAETITAAGGITADIAGINIIGLGTGADRPELTFSTAVGASLVVSAANVQIANIVGISGVDGLTNPFHIQAAGCTLGNFQNGPVEWQDPSSSLQAVRAVLTTAAADNFNVNLKVTGITSGGTAPVNAVRLVGCNDATINCDFYGRASTAYVEFVTTACSNIEVYGYMYNSGVTDGTKDVIDTVTGSTWFADFLDGAAGSSYAGGSAAALAADDISTVAANLNVPTADVTTNTLERDVIGNKTDAAVTAVGTTKTIVAYAKGHTTMLTVQSADSTNNAFAGDVVGNKTDAAVTAVGTTKSIAAYAKGLVTMATVQSADSTANAFAGDVIGNKTDAAQPIVGTTRSIMGALKGLMNSTERTVVKTDGAVLSGADALFTVTGGMILVRNIVGRVTTIIGGAANGTLQATTTVPASTTAMSTTVAVDSDAAGTIYTFVGPTGVLTPTTAGVVLMDFGSTTVTPTQYIVNAGTIEFLGSAAQSGVIEWTMDYLPLSPSVVVAAAA